MRRLFLETKVGILITCVSAFTVLCLVSRLWGNEAGTVLVYGTVFLIFFGIVFKSMPGELRERRRQKDGEFLRRIGMPDEYRACSDVRCDLPRPHGHPEGHPFYRTTWMS